MTRFRPKSLAAVSALLFMVAVFIVALNGAAGALVNHGGVAPELPRDDLPLVINGKVRSHAQLGDLILVGGAFSQIELRDGSVHNVSNIYAYDLNTGAWVSSFTPQVNDTVRHIEVAPDGSGFYIGGKFSQIDGQSRSRAAKFNADLTLNSSFTPTLNAVVGSIAASPTTVYLGGAFTQVNGVAQAGLAAVDPVTGASDPGFTIALSDPITARDVTTGQNFPELRAWQVLLTPDYSTLISAHSAFTVGGLPRAGLAKIDVSANPAVVTNWTAPLYTDNNCRTGANRDYVMRDAAISPDGTYIVVVNGGGDRPPLCDTAIRFDITSNAPTAPTWIARMYSSLFSVGISDAAVYVSGHFCAAPKNPIPLGGISSDYPGLLQGCETVDNNNGRLAPYLADPDNAVFRNQIAALNPVHGQALDWNPGTDNQVGGFDMTVIDRGVLYGGDSNRVNDIRVGRSGFFDFGVPDDVTPPTLTVDSPSAGATTDPTVVVSGSVVDDRGIADVSTRILDLGTGLWRQANGSFGQNPVDFAADLTFINPTEAQFSLTPFGLTPADYRITVSATDPSGNNAQTNINITIDPQVGGPTSCTATIVGDDVRIDWVELEDITQYSIRRSNKWLANVSNNTTYLDVAPPGGDYTYVVRVKRNGVNFDGVCGPDPITVVGQPPTELVCLVSRLGDGTELTWNAVPGVSRYYVRGDGRYLATVNNDTTYVDTDGSVTIDYVVRYRLDGILIDASCTVDFTPPPLLTPGNIVQIRNPQLNTWLGVNGELAVTSTTFDDFTRWRLHDPEGDGTYALWNVGRTKYLDGDNNKIDVHSNQLGTDRHWEFIDLGNGEYRLQNVRFERLLEAAGANANAGWDTPPAEANDVWVVTLAP